MRAADLTDERRRQEIGRGVVRLCVGRKQPVQIGQRWITGGGDQQAELAPETPAGLDRHRDAFVKPARQRPAAGAGRQCQVHDLMPDDGLERVMRIGTDACREDENVTRTECLRRHPRRCRPCSRVIFLDESNPRADRRLESGACERALEPRRIELADALRDGLE